MVADDSRRATVLVVEDDEDCQVLTRVYLEAAGLHVEIVASLHDALSLLDLAADLYDVVVADLHLPDHDGAHSLELLRSATGAPVVVHSAAHRSILDRARQQGADEVVPKGNFTRLAEVIGSFVAVPDHGTDDPAPPTRDGAGTTDVSAVTGHVVQALAELTGIGTWMVTRLVEEDWVVLAVHDRDGAYGLFPGLVLPWRDWFRDHGAGTEAGGKATIEPASDATPPDPSIAVGCAVVVPLVIEGGLLSGALCGIDPAPHPDPDRLLGTRGHLELLGAVLAAALAVELDRARLQRRNDVAASAAQTDLLTGVGNRRAWEQALRVEDARCARYAHLAGVAMVDLDDLKAVNDTDGHSAGDEMIRRFAHALRATVRAGDQVFRLGGDEFAVLLPECGQDDLAIVVDRLRSALGEQRIGASVGAAVRHPADDLWATAERADTAMYADKAARKGRARKEADAAD